MGEGNIKKWKWPVIVASSTLGALIIIAVAFIATDAPHASLTSSRTSLATVHMTGISQTVEAVQISVDHKSVGAKVDHDQITPTHQVPLATDVDLTVTLRRASWIGWLIGSTETLHETIVTPTTKFINPMSVEPSGDPVVAKFSKPVRIIRVSHGDRTYLLFPRHPTTSEALDDIIGTSAAGTFQISASPEKWESFSKPAPFVYFHANSNAPMAVISKTTDLSPSSSIDITLSRPIAQLFGTSQPTITPTIGPADAVHGSWTKSSKYTMSFTPSGPVFLPGGHLTLSLPASVAVVHANGSVSPATKHIPLSSKIAIPQPVPSTPSSQWLEERAFPSVSNVGNGNPAVPIGNYVERYPGNSGPNGLDDGPPWSGPHYVLQITSSSSQQVAGEVYFIFEDGRVGKVFAFNGVLSANNNLATLVTGPPQITVGYPSPAAVNNGTTLRAPVDNRSITLDGCQHYLHWLSPAGGAPANTYQDNPYECTFAYMGSSALYN